MYAQSENLFVALRQNGGFTVHVHTGERPEPGQKKFAVAWSKQTERTFDLAHFTPTDLVDYIASNSEVLSFPGVYLGAWIDGPTVYLDCSLVTDSETSALITAEENDQIAIFCFEDMESRTLESYQIAASQTAFDKLFTALEAEIELAS